MALNAFDLRTMTMVIDQRKRPMTFLRSRWATRAPQVHPTKTFDIDLVKGGIRVAPFVSPIREGKVMRAEGLKTFNVQPGYLKPKRVLTPADAQKRLPGETIYSQRTLQDRLEVLGAAALGDLDDACINREEVMLRDAILDGKIKIYEDINGTLTEVREIDFLRTAALTATLGLGTWWSTSSTTILDNLQTWAGLLRANGGVGPNVCIMAPDVTAVVVKNTSILALLDNRRVEQGGIAPAEIVPGVDYVGELRAPGCYVQLWCDSRTYTNESGAETAMMPAKNLLLGSTQVPVEMHYGPIEDLEAATELGIPGDGMIPAQRFPKTWTEKDPSVRHILMQTAPLPVPTNPDAFLRATVLA